MSKAKTHMPRSWFEKLTCKWQFNDYNEWVSSCRKRYRFPHNVPDEKTYIFCPGCGRRIKL